MWPGQDYKQQIIHVDDTSSEDLLAHFQECIDFIKDGLRQRGKVLVHCIAGVSRSPTVGHAIYPIYQTRQRVAEQWLLPVSAVLLP